MIIQIPLFQTITIQEITGQKSNQIGQDIMILCELSIIESIQSATRLLEIGVQLLYVYHCSPLI